MQANLQFKFHILLLICLNIALQITTFCLMKFSWVYAQHSTIKLINYITLLAFSASFLRAFIWQHILKVNNLASSYLPNAIIPSLLLLAGYFLFDEQITLFNALGSLIILAGLALFIRSTVKR
ncbi:hypothetical protein [Aquicella lusitana]|uniref:EamA-like transporter family protein n=1 Tax=Aquicella lusitana TaxID=254246 RepID=A0A370GN17_9COXI|nr:hypothetical protein [Aquicella lusitana]RDI45125.1 hypothetical protein C8D86_1071 [Aquicella lusitana]VVC72805.1 hypothetical protein AQULUS_05290 [Aquicella lusitana]